MNETEYWNLVQRTVNDSDPESLEHYCRITPIVPGAVINYSNNSSAFVDKFGVSALSKLAAEKGWSELLSAIALEAFHADCLEYQRKVRKDFIPKCRRR